MESIVSNDAKVEILAKGHDWTEGPLWVESEQILLYCDIPRNSIYAWKEGEDSKLYLKPSGFLGENFTGTEPGSNGLILDENEALVLCQHGDRKIVRMNSSLSKPEASFITLVDAYNEKRLNSPNDLDYMNNGDLYFTDPPYGLPKRMNDSEKELSFQGVFRLSKNGKVTLLTDEFERPNGIAFSPDEKTLYIANSLKERPIWKAFDVTKDGLITNGRVILDASERIKKGELGLPDGLKVGKNGTIYASGPGGVFIFSAEEEFLGVIKTGERTSNCALNADESMLYITADSYLLRVALN
ncbi:SMP-30/gluconolactonase/LRE family protein [Thalassobellus sediminis]|uniref:SMP-30/gluconolactonase/LRE family protein n=1 Tax=Thalassobellus sediminis TaxID=3367753 RepID=UPI0037A84381